MFQILLTLLMSFSGFSYDGQPREVVAMPDMATKVVMTLPEVSASDFELKKVKCYEQQCRAFARAVSEKSGTVGTISYQLKLAWVNVNQKGELVEPFSAPILVFEEPETGNRVTLTYKDKAGVCFGKGHGSRNLCSYGTITETF